HHAVDLAEARHRLLDQPRADTGLSQITLDDQGLRPRRADLLRHALRAAAVLAGMDRDRCFGSGQRAGRGGADAGRGAGDEEDSHRALLPKVKVARNVPATRRGARRSRGLAIGAGQARPRETRAAAPAAAPQRYASRCWLSWSARSS